MGAQGRTIIQVWFHSDSVIPILATFYMIKTHGRKSIFRLYTVVG